MTMRALVLGEDRSLAVQEVERPEAANGQVRVRIAACGICGTDLHRRSSAPAGSIFGHEAAGVVDVVGSGVTGFAPGDHVCVYPGTPADRHDFRVAVATGIGLGRVAGAFAEAVVVPSEALWRLPDGMPVEHGALVEPVAVALHGLAIGEADGAEPAAVIGAGPIGMLCALALKARGVEHVVAVEPNTRRRAQLAAMGVESVDLEDARATVRAALGARPELVLECAGHPSAPALAVELLADSGRIVLLGAPHGPIELDQIALIAKEAQLRASFAYRPGDFTEAVEMLARGDFPVQQLITAVEPLERAPAMFDELVRPGSDHVKVLVAP